MISFLSILDFGSCVSDFLAEKVYDYKLALAFCSCVAVSLIIARSVLSLSADVLFVAVPYLNESPSFPSNNSELRLSVDSYS